MNSSQAAAKIRQLLVKWDAENYHGAPRRPSHQHNVEYYMTAVVCGYLSKETRTTHESSCSVCFRRQPSGIRKFWQERPTSDTSNAKESFWCRICDACWSELVSIPVEIDAEIVTA